MIISPTKTVYTIYAPREKEIQKTQWQNKYPLLIDDEGTSMKYSNSTRLLGVFFDEYMTVS